MVSVSSLICLQALYRRACGLDALGGQSCLKAAVRDCRDAMSMLLPHGMGTPLKDIVGNERGGGGGRGGPLASVVKEVEALLARLERTLGSDGSRSEGSGSGSGESSLLPIPSSVLWPIGSAASTPSLSDSYPGSSLESSKDLQEPDPDLDLHRLVASRSGGFLSIGEHPSRGRGLERATLKGMDLDAESKPRDVLKEGAYFGCSSPSSRRAEPAGGPTDTQGAGLAEGPPGMDVLRDRPAAFVLTKRLRLRRCGGCGRGPLEPSVAVPCRACPMVSVDGVDPELQMLPMISNTDICIML